MWKHFLTAVFCCAGAISTERVARSADVNDFLDFSTEGLPGRLFVPDVLTSSGPNDHAPLIVFLHGAGETGTNNTSQVNRNIDNLLDVAKQRGAFLYAPQATTFNWSSIGRTGRVMQMVDQALATYDIDPLRLYVTGLSMGGGGTWNMLNRFSDRFAAGVPIAAISPAGDFDPADLVNLPLWAFHARDDGVVSERNTHRVVNDILAAAGKSPPTYPSNQDRVTTLEFVDDELNLRYTEWPRGGHGIWGRVYADPQLRDWMFAQTRAIPEPAAAVLMLSLTTAVVSRRRFARRQRHEISP